MSAALTAGTAALAGLAAAAWPAPTHVHHFDPEQALRPRPATADVARVPLLITAVLVVVVVAWWSGPVGAVLAGVVGVSTVRGRAAGREAAAAAAQAERAFEGCGVLVDELRAGRLPAAALRSAGVVDPAVLPAARAVESGGDVAAQLRATGVRAHRLVAAAWQVAERQGSGLVDALVRVQEGLRADRRTARLVASELASARSTARLLVLLPALALGVAVLSVDGVVAFLASRAGALVVLLGVTLLRLGTAWIDRIARSVAAS